MRLEEVATTVDMVVDEQIWGHRLYDEQTPWLCFLEFLTVYESKMNEGKALFEESENIKYLPLRRIYLRNILFNNPYITMIQNDFSDDESKWDAWNNKMVKTSAGKDNFDFNYLRHKFGSFDDFNKTIKLLRSTAIEEQSNKRWSSKFVFPYGVGCIYEDLRVNGIKVSNDRRFFARTGELLYLMLCRSGKQDELSEIINKNILVDQNKWNRLVNILQPNNIDRAHEAHPLGYLPQSDPTGFKLLAEDWLRLFSNDMPHNDVLPHLVTITGLHMLMYFLRQSQKVLNNKDKALFVLEIISPSKTGVRDLSADYYTLNNGLSKMAVETYIRNIKSTPEWKQCSEYNEYLNVVKEKFGWPNGASHYITTAEQLIDELVDQSLSRHKQHIQKFHSVWAKEIGLASANSSRRTRYTPTDDLIKTLVFSTVERRMEFNDFLRNLYEKYGILVGEKEARKIIDQGLVDQETFSDNAKRLEQRMISMGLLKRLSDACAYVINPFGGKNYE